MPNIEFKFGIGDKIKILDLNIHGRIIGLYFGDTGKQYQVSYFMDKDIKRNYFYEFELELVEDMYKYTMGFIKKENHE